MQSEHTNELSAALAKAQRDMKAATFNRINPHYKNRYADLASVIDAIREPLAANGLAYTQTGEIREGGFVLVTTLHHSSGQWVASEYPLPIGAKPQELGSALTYARRYSLCAIACIAADDDDDAEQAEKVGHKASTPQARINPHVTRPEDLSDAVVEYNEHGEPIDNIPLGDKRIETMTKARARPDFASAQMEMRKAQTPKELETWGRNNANRVASYPTEWQEILRNMYAEQMQEIRAKSEPENVLQAG
jgi:ERF superfamily